MTAKTFSWVFLVLFFMVFLSAIIMTDMIGHHGTEYGDDITASWCSVITSGYSLFQITTVENWDSFAEPLMEKDWRWGIFFALFIIFAAWTLISLFTALASDARVQQSSSESDPFEMSDDAESSHESWVKFLYGVFKEVDTDMSATLDKAEFRRLMSRSDVRDRILNGLDMTEEELMKAWDIFDVDESGELSIDELISGLSILQEILQTRHVVSLDYGVRRVSVKINSRMMKIQHEIDHVRKQKEEISSILDLTEKIQSQHWSDFMGHEGFESLARAFPKGSPRQKKQEAHGSKSSIT